MTAFPDTSFLFALYRPQDNSQTVQARYETMTEAIHTAGLLLFELRQSVRLQVWLHSQTSGASERDGLNCRGGWALR